MFLFHQFYVVFFNSFVYSIHRFFLVLIGIGNEQIPSVFKPLTLGRKITTTKKQSPQ